MKKKDYDKYLLYLFEKIKKFNSVNDEYGWNKYFRQCAINYWIKFIRDLKVEYKVGYI